MLARNAGGRRGKYVVERLTHMEHMGPMSSSSSHHRTGRVALLVAVGLSLAACGSDEASPIDSTATVPTGAVDPTSPPTTPADTAGTSPLDTAAPDTTVPPASAPDTSVPITSAPEPGRPSVPESPLAYESAITDVVVDNPAFDEMEANITGLLTRVGLPGASLLVVQHGELVEQEAWLEYGLDKAVPIASATKWLTAATIMTLVDDGLIDLDAPMSTYVPEAAGFPVGTITMRMLLSFTSGLVADERVPCFDDASSTLQDCAREIVKMGTVHPPGAAFRYGGQHMHVAGAIAEIVTGQSFVDLLSERILQPLGMTRTALFQVGDFRLDDVTHPSPAGTGASTLGDYARFVEMLAHDGVAPDGTVVLTAESVAEMQRDQIADAAYVSAAAFRVATESPYGLGQWIDWTDESGNAIVVSSDGKFGFRPWIDRVNDLFGVYLIDDRGEGYVEGDPDAAADTGEKVHTSGLWIFEWVAEALGGSLPDVAYPHRS